MNRFDTIILTSTLITAVITFFLYVATYKKNVITAVMRVEVSIIVSKRFIEYFDVLFSRYKIS